MSKFCRSGDCEKRAVFKIKVVSSNSHDRDWKGAFCSRHLLRCIPIKMRSLTDNQTILIARIK